MPCHPPVSPSLSSFPFSFSLFSLVSLFVYTYLGKILPYRLRSRIRPFGSHQADLVQNRKAPDLNSSRPDLTGSGVFGRWPWERKRKSFLKKSCKRVHFALPLAFASHSHLLLPLDAVEHKTAAYIMLSWGNPFYLLSRTKNDHGFWLVLLDESCFNFMLDTNRTSYQPNPQLWPDSAYKKENNKFICISIFIYR